jgi:hypothetical protein
MMRSRETLTGAKWRGASKARDSRVLIKSAPVAAAPRRKSRRLKLGPQASRLLFTAGA